MGVGVMVWFRGHHHDRLMWNQEKERILLNSGVATMRHGGTNAFIALISNQRGLRQPPLFAFDETGHELLGRMPPDFRFDRQLMRGKEDSLSPIEKVKAPDGHDYWLMVGRPPPEANLFSIINPFKIHDRGPSSMHGDALPPSLLIPLLSGLVFSFIFAAILARYISKPILNLHQALVAFADGDLNRRTAPSMGKRRDELAALGDDFDKMAQQLQSLMSSQQRLLHDVSHEMRSPLARLQANIGLMKEHPEQMDLTLFMQRLELESERIDRLVNELLTLSRLESGIKTGSTTEVELNEILSIVVDDAKVEGQSKLLTIDLETEEQIIVNADPELLHRAIENIVRNSIRHSPDQGTIKVNANLKVEKIFITIFDQGSGVPEGDLKKIFEPFYRSSNGVGKGHGLGLAIAERIIRMYGGTIFAANEASGGLRVIVTLPNTA